MVLSFLVFLGLFVIIGVSSALKSRGTKKDYYLASNSVSPALVGLSAVATNNSGYMFIGLIGYTYSVGLASLWLMVGWIAGDYIASTMVHKRLRLATQTTGEVSYAGVLSHWFGNKFIILRRVLALVAVIFLLAYAGAQLIAGSKALNALFGWPIASGAILSAILVILYCVAGGIRASIWTDAAQSLVMIVAMAILLYVATQALGGPSAAVEKMQSVEGFLDVFPADLLLPGISGIALFVVGWMFAGFSIIGQPHIMVRFMALDDAGKMRNARAWYYSWYCVFYAMAAAVGLLSRIYLVDNGSFDAELALPTMAQQLLPPALTGLILAGIFAATMSTADSLILSCSATISHDLLPFKIEKTVVLKLITVAIALGALAWALLNSQSVFSLVIMAWSGMASAFAPLLLMLCLGKRPGQVVSVVAVVVGLIVALAWRMLGWHNDIYEGMAGIIAGLLVLNIPLFSVSFSSKKQIKTS